MTENNGSKAPQAYAYEDAIESGVADIVAKNLVGDKANIDIGSLIAAANQFVESIIDDITDKTPPPEDVACTKGCSFCCWRFEVQVTAIEVFIIRDALIASKTEEELTRILDTLMAVTKEKESIQARVADGSMTPEERLPLFPCVLLSQGLCSVYDTRPLFCRGYNAYDAKACESVKSDPNSSQIIRGFIHPVKITEAAFRGLNIGITQAGLSADVLDLMPALGIAMVNLDSKERWLAGEDIFANAKTTLAA